jgi:hypothetical protein
MATSFALPTACPQRQSKRLANKRSWCFFLAHIYFAHFKGKSYQLEEKKFILPKTG